MSIWAGKARKGTDMARLNQERQDRLEPKRIDGVEKELRALGFTPERINGGLRFLFKGSMVTVWPYSGWFSGKTVQDGRGFANLKKQLIAAHGSRRPNGARKDRTNNSEETDMGKQKWKEEYNYRKTVEMDMARCSTCKHHVAYVFQDKCRKHNARVSYFGLCNLFEPKRG